MNRDPEFAFDKDDDYDMAVSEALGEEPRAHELREMTQALQLRRERLLRDLDALAPEERDRLRKDLHKLDEQIAALREEAGITQFVEDAVRASLEMRKLQN